MKRRREDPRYSRSMMASRILTLGALGVVTILSTVANGGQSKNFPKEPNSTTLDHQNNPHQALHNDACASDHEENHVGRMYLEFKGNPTDTMSDDDLWSMQELLSDVYQEVSSENCPGGFRFLYGVELDRNSTIPSAADNQYRIQLNVIYRCKGCSKDLRFFSNGFSGRSQGRFLEVEAISNNSQSGLLGQRKRGSGLFDQRDNGSGGNLLEVEPFLTTDQGCDCPPPSRQQVLNRLQQKLKEQNGKGKMKNVQQVVAWGAYFSGLQGNKYPNGQVRISRPELNATEKAEAMSITCPQKPPFSPPFSIPDVASFQGLSTCPFNLHEHVIGEPVGSCFPIYDIPHWYSQHSVTFMLRQLISGDTLFFEKEQQFATWEEILDLSAIDDTADMQTCLKTLDFSAVGVLGEVSGEMGTVTISAIVASFVIEGAWQYLLLPAGGCEDSVYVGEVQRRRTLLQENDKSSEDCTLQPEGSLGEDEKCINQCVEAAQSDYASKLDMLQKLYEAKLFKNDLNEQAVTNKLFLKRTADVSMTLAQCLCTVEESLEACVLGGFLEAVATETDQRFEALEIFGNHRLVAQEELGGRKPVACAAASDTLRTCQDGC